MSSRTVLKPCNRDQSFADVPITTDGVETASFLEASDGLVNMFGAFSLNLCFRRTCLMPFIKDLLGTGVFTFVQCDIRSNIAVRPTDIVPRIF